MSTADTVKDDIPLTLWTGESTADDEAPWATYATEVLAHAGLDHGSATDASAGALPERGVVLVTGPVQDSDAEQLQAWVRRGGSLVLTAAAGPLAGLAGVEEGRAIGSELITCAEAWSHHPQSALRALAGTALQPAQGTAVLATLGDGAAAITRREVGAGVVFTFGVDLWYTIARIQQGYPVSEDGTPSRDGSAPIDDDLLKAEDGMALDLEADRALPPGEPPVPDDYTHTYPPPSAVPIFDQPHADWWRSLFLQTIWRAAEHAGAPLAWLDYWPAGVDAIAHMSHDADGNRAEDGRAALDAFAAADVKVTWHQVFPGGYPPEILAEVTTAGHEQSLHYNSMADADLAQWGWPQIRAQYAWAQAVTGREDIVSNKNHYTRWEGWTEFYTWCERLGIQIDSSRGPSKQGTVGFPFGTAHVSFPLAPTGTTAPFHDVLNLPLHTQDLAWAGHISVRDVILDGAQAQHGVAHFLFHGPHLNRRPLTRQACLDVAAEARRRGMPWWTAEQINTWERARRGVRVQLQRTDDGWLVQVHAEQALAGAALILPVPESVRAQDPGAAVRSVQRHGHTFVELGVDLPAGTSFWQLR